ncbi:MAG: hypothetical protein Q7R96_03825 [Nanoarchaeota archaeon]|nr:hypothetical protein [Nanoarchaeota archaeon]
MDQELANQKLKVLWGGLNKLPVDLERLLNDADAGKLEVVMRWLSLSEKQEKDILVWALKKYDIAPTYPLRTKNNVVIGMLDLREDLEELFEDTDSRIVLSNMQALGIELDDFSAELIEDYGEYRVLGTLNRVIAKEKKRQKVDVTQEYVEQVGKLKRGEYALEGEEITGTVPREFRMQSDVCYLVAPQVFPQKTSQQGRVLLPIVSIETKGRYGLIDINQQTPEDMITDKKKAVQVLEMLMTYVSTR